MPDSELTRAMIVNWSLAELGLAANFSIDEQTPRGADVGIFWPRAIAHAFSLTDWTDFRRTSQLTRQSAAPDTGYTYGYDLPGDRLGPPMKLLSDPRRETPLRDFRIEGDTMSCDEPVAWAVCKVERDPAYWDPQFANAFAVLLASYLAVPQLQDVDMAAEKMAQAIGTRGEGGTGGMFGRLIAQNKAAHPMASPLYRNDPLTAGRGGGDWYGRG